MTSVEVAEGSQQRLVIVAQLARPEPGGRRAGERPPFHRACTSASEPLPRGDPRYRELPQAGQPVADGARACRREPLSRVAGSARPGATRYVRKDTRLYYDKLCSQHLAFNLFGPLALRPDGRLARTLCKWIAPELKTGDAIRIECAPLYQATKPATTRAPSQSNRKAFAGTQGGT